MPKSMKLNLLDYKKNIYSQNGEDGIIKKIFEIVGVKNKISCEFGAWDGIHLSNTRNLILNGWTSIMIEGDRKRFNELAKNYKNNKKVYCVKRYVDTKENTLSKILAGLPIADLEEKIDLLSIDIDGLDYEIFRIFDILPRVICVEVNAGHYPNSNVEIKKNIAKNNIGQPLSYFSKIAKEKDYSLVCYSGNAFYIKNDISIKKNIKGLTDLEAYISFIDHLDKKAKEWLLLVNKDLVSPYFKFNNPLLSAEKLEIGVIRKIYLYLQNFLGKYI